MHIQLDKKMIINKDYLQAYLQQAASLIKKLRVKNGI